MTYLVDSLDEEGAWDVGCRRIFLDNEAEHYCSLMQSLSRVRMYRNSKDQRRTDAGKLEPILISRLTHCISCCLRRKGLLSV